MQFIYEPEGGERIEFDDPLRFRYYLEEEAKFAEDIVERAGNPRVPSGALPENLLNEIRNAARSLNELASKLAGC